MFFLIKYGKEFKVRETVPFGSLKTRSEEKQRKRVVYRFGGFWKLREGSPDDDMTNPRVKASKRKSKLIFLAFKNIIRTPNHFFHTSKSK
ncbi:hypothetical protein TNCV_1385211 [Trichonephila clavipes]|nr:hypothetical protein TNCV_1385211 [Trichonephila clavipes]